VPAPSSNLSRFRTSRKEWFAINNHALAHRDIHTTLTAISSTNFRWKAEPLGCMAVFQTLSFSLYSG